MNQKMREYYSRLSERYYLWNARKALAASGTIWNGLWPNGTPEGLLERAKRSGTEPQALLGTPARLLERAKRYTAFTGLRSASAKYRARPQFASSDAMTCLVNCSLSKCPTSMMPMRPAFSIN